MKTELIIGIILLFITLYLAFFKSYLTEKGKSVALKEDLKELTSEVESVKDKFVKEQEIMKTDLQRILNNELSYRNEERDAIISFHGIINQWIYSILEVHLSNYDRINLTELVDIRNNNSLYYAKAGIAKSKIILLIEDKNLVEATNGLYLSVMNFHYWSDSIFLKYQLNCEQQKSLIERFLILTKYDDENKEFAKKMAEDEKGLKAEQKEIYENYLDNERNIEFQKTISFEDEFEKLAKEYLKN